MRYDARMAIVIDQSGENRWDIEWFKIEEDASLEAPFSIVAMARIDLTRTEIVELGRYTFYKQAIETFAEIDKIASDIMFYRTHKKLYQLPPNVSDPIQCLMIYGSLY